MKGARFRVTFCYLQSTGDNMETPVKIDFQGMDAHSDVRFRKLQGQVKHHDGAPIGD